MSAAATIRGYHVEAFFSEEDECWVADAPDLKSCSAFGNSPEEALREIDIAMGLWLEVAREGGLALPRARGAPGDA